MTPGGFAVDLYIAYGVVGFNKVQKSQGSSLLKRIIRDIEVVQSFPMFQSFSQYFHPSIRDFIFPQVDAPHGCIACQHRCHEQNIRIIECISGQRQRFDAFILSKSS
mmetsp:Transcript_30943/g.89425  ORF Transcript_30943/g.89425 Transcript_30943/m.89425 type:complete len:107 (+) Transcript_30943:67-387(+)